MPWRKGNRLRLVGESEATGEVAEIFDELKAALGINYVPLEFQAFAAFPEFLRIQWRTFRPLFGTREFFDLAEKLQAEAYTHVHNYCKIAPLGEGLAVLQAAPVLDQLCRVQSAMLLMLSAQVQAFDAPVGKADDAHPAERLASAPAPEFVEAESAPAGVRRAMDDIRHALDLPFSGDEQRVLAQWPDLYFAFALGLKPALQSALHEQAIYRMRESAWHCAQDLPLVIEMEFPRLLEAGASEENIATVTRLSELLVRGSAAGLLNASFARIALEGGNLAETPSPSAPVEKVA